MSEKTNNIISVKNLNPDLKTDLAKLYEEADKLNGLEPWKYFRELDMVVIELPEAVEPFYVSIVGNGSDMKGIHVMPNVEAYANYWRLALTTSKDSERLKYERTHMSVFYTSNLSDDQKEILKAAGIKAKDIAFCSFMPGYAPRYLCENEVRQLIRVYQHLQVIVNKQISGEMKADFQQQKTIIRFYNVDKNGWETVEDEAYFPDLDYMQIATPEEDEAIKDCLKKPKKPETLELDLFYLPTPIQAEEGDYAYYPKMMLLAGADNGQLYYNDMLVEEDVPSIAVLSALTNYILKEGRPRKIKINQQYLYRLIEDFCKKMEIEMIYTDELDQINKFKTKL